MTRVLGILGGMSWVSTQSYYRQINELVARARGRQHCADLLLASRDFQPIVDAQARGDWDAVADRLAEIAQGLERAGATAFLIASNTMHLAYERVAAAVGIPGLSIFDAAATALQAAGVSQAAFLGTRYAMGHPFFLREFGRRGVELMQIPAADALKVNEIIFKELIHGVVRHESAGAVRHIAQRLRAAGAAGVVLGCTELALLFPEPEEGLHDTIALHAAMAARWLMGERSPAPPKAAS